MERDFEAAVRASLQEINQRLSDIEEGVRRIESCSSLMPSNSSRPSSPIPPLSFRHSTSTLDHVILASSEANSASSTGFLSSSPKEAVLDKAKLESYVEETFMQTCFPDEQEIGNIVRHITMDLPYLGAKNVTPQVREWFRKQREYMTHRINTVCQNVLKQGEAKVVQFLKDLGNDEACDRIAIKAKLRTKNPVEIRQFVREKIAAFFDKVNLKPKAEDTPEEDGDDCDGQCSLDEMMDKLDSAIAGIKANSSSPGSNKKKSKKREREED